MGGEELEFGEGRWKMGGKRKKEEWDRDLGADLLGPDPRLNGRYPVHLEMVGGEGFEPPTYWM
jgi:hypothetical protein